MTLKDHFRHPSYNPAALLDTVLKKLALKNDAALSRELNITTQTISKVRNRKMPVGAVLAMTIMEAADITPNDLYEWMGVL